MTKRLFRIFVSYGKGDGEEVSDQFVMEDTAENREEMLYEHTGMFSELLSDKDEFISGKSDSVDILLDGGDWDDPTGKAIEVYDKDELINGENARHKRELAYIERLFEEVVE